MQNSSVEQNTETPKWLKGELPPIPDNENERLKALSKYESPTSEPVHDEAFDRLASLASLICDKPISFINLIGSEKEFKKACYGFNGQTTPRENSFCQYTIMQDDILEIKDVQQHNLFKNNPNVEGPLKLRYYAGVPLKTEEGYNIGTLCIIDHKPGALNERQKESLRTLADEIISRFELIAAREELERRNNEKDELIRIVSHDMRNPLMGIIGFSELMQHEIDDEGHIENLGHIQRSGESLLNIVNVLLNSDYVRNEASFIVNKKNGNASEITRSVVNLYRPSARLKQHQLNIEIDEGIEGEFDIEKWKQIVGNLLGNAIKFTENGGEIQLNLTVTEKRKRFLDLQISDSGIGMEKDMLDDLFSGKDKIRREGTEGEETTGLGMFIVKKYIRLLNGTINVDSEPGRGTTFRILIPITTNG